jgi:sterol 3beta-glucosyltransferase
MKILVLTYGTEGDTRPLAALSHALRRAGHDVELLADSHTLRSALELGVPASALTGDIRELVAGSRPQHPHDMAKALMQLTNRNTESWMAQTLGAARGCDGILSCGLAGFVGLSVGECLAIPTIGAGMIPLTPSNEFASPFLPPRLVPSWLNGSSLRLTNQLVWLTLRKSLNNARRTVLGLPPRKKMPADHTMLYGISPTLLTQPADWPTNARICGQWLVPAGDYLPVPELAAFLEAGPAPIYMGFGSMAGIDVPSALSALVSALDGRRALFFPGWSGTGDLHLPDTVLRVDATPHDWLFPRTSAVIHHGGSGTSHSATRAGKPSIVVPFAGDQAFWAGRLAQLGVAPSALDATVISARTLREAIAFVEQPAVQQRAAQLGRGMAGEDGLAMAVTAIEKQWAQPA